MKILVTGAAGFIGFHIVHALINAGYTVVGIDNISSYYDVQLKYARLKKMGIEENEINESKIDESKIDSKEEPYYEPKQWNTEFNTKKYLCRNCGMIFEIMPNEFLKLYNEQSKLFKNKD